MKVLMRKGLALGTLIAVASLFSVGVKAQDYTADQQQGTTPEQTGQAPQAVTDQQSASNAQLQRALTGGRVNEVALYVNPLPRYTDQSRVILSGKAYGVDGVHIQIVDGRKQDGNKALFIPVNEFNGSFMKEIRLDEGTNKIKIFVKRGGERESVTERISRQD